LPLRFVTFGRHMKQPLTILALLMTCSLYAQRVSGPTLNHHSSSRALSFDGELLYVESFENGDLTNLPNDWSSFSPSGVPFFTGVAGDAPSQANENGFWPVPFHGIFAMTNDDVCDCDKSNDRLISRTFNLAGLSDVQLGFSAFQNGSAGQQAWVEIRTTGQPWFQLLEIPASSQWQDHQIFIPTGFLGPGFQIRFVYSDNGAYASGLALDDIFLGVSAEQNLKLNEFYTINGDDGAASDFYDLIPISQARFANLRPGASVDNSSISSSNAQLEAEMSGTLSASDSHGVWLLNAFESQILRFTPDQTLNPRDSGAYTIEMTLETDSTDLVSGDNQASVSFGVTDSLYQRHHGETDGTGIWVLNPIDRIGLVYHLFQDDSIKTVRVAYHPACDSNSRYRIKVFKYETLTSSFAQSDPIIITNDEIGQTVDVPVEFDLEAGKYLFVIEKETGRIVISTNQFQRATTGNVLSQRVGQEWTDFPYVPFISLVLPVDTPCNDFISATVEQVSCSGVNDGSIEVSLGSGIPDTYDWSFFNGNNPIATNLAAGTYTVTVTDVTGCEYIRSFQLPDPDTLGITMSTSNDTCSGSLGGIASNGFGGHEPYMFDWSNGSTSQELSGLSAGTYTLTLTDANGCVVDSIVEIEGSPGFIVNIDIQQSGCGDTNGILSPDVLGGIGEFNYLWSNDSTQDTLMNLHAGVYTLTVSDSLGCSEQITVELNDSNSAALSIIDLEDVQCWGTNTGLIRIAATGSGPFTYAWSNGSTADSAAQITAGDYDVTVTDLNGCRSILRSSVQESSTPLHLSLDEIGILCHGDSSGSILSYAWGGSTPYTYAWSTGASNESLTDVTADSYRLTLTDANDCFMSDSVVIDELPPFFLTVDSINRLSDSLIIPDGAIYTSAFGGTQPYNFVWNNGETTPNIMGLDSGLYQLTVTDQMGCVQSLEELMSKYPLSVTPINTGTNDLLVYPNPARTGHTIQLLSESTPLALQLLDMRGSVVNTFPQDANGSYTLPLIPAGLYMLRVEYKSGQKDYKHLLIIR